MASQQLQQSNSGKQRYFYGYIVVAFAFIIMMLVQGTRFSFGVYFKPVLIEFGWTRAMTSGAFSLATMVHGLLGIIMGGLTDRLGPRIVLTLCGFLLGLGYLLMSQISAIWQLYLFYGVIIGIGTSGLWVPIMSTVARWFTKRRSTMTGIVIGGGGLGTLILSPLASRLIAAYDWRISYIMMGGFVLIVLVPLAQLLKRDPTQMGQVPHGENREGVREVKLSSEGLSLSEAVHTRQFCLALSMMFFNGFPLVTIMVHIVPNATDLGISPISAANILAIIGGIGIVSRVTMGSIADRIGNRQAYIIGFIIMSAAMLWLLTATELWMFYLFAVLYGLATGIVVLGSPLTAEIFGLRSHGLILGVINLGHNTGAAIGPLLAGYIFDITDSYNIAFLVCAALSIACILLAYLIRPTYRGSFGVKIQV
ncbi:MFS transporter [Chloroflexota bacterium]